MCDRIWLLIILVSLATILAMEPEILLLDEPTTGLDNEIRVKIAQVLSALDISYILISHNIDFLSNLTDSIYTMEKGKILLDKTVHIHEHLHAHPHGKYPHEHK